MAVDRRLCSLFLVVLLAACGAAEARPMSPVGTVIAAATMTSPSTGPVQSWWPEPAASAHVPATASLVPTHVPTPTSTPVTPIPTATPRTPPQPYPEARFATLPPGSALPDGTACAARVRRHPWEPRPGNTVANHTIPTGVALPPWGGVAPRANTELLSRVDGAFAGTTDEIIQWAACKWGLDEDVARAMAVQESNWHQAARADLAHDPARCVAGDAPPCPTSFGLFQIKWTAFPGTYPASAQSTAFNADYALAVLRACYEGHERWLDDVQQGRPYASGDLWGCLGRWYAGRWHTPAAEDYIAHVQARLDARDWDMPDFPWR